jgi:hypothetical protein
MLSVVGAVPSAAQADSEAARVDRAASAGRPAVVALMQQAQTNRALASAMLAAATATTTTSSGDGLVEVGSATSAPGVVQSLVASGCHASVSAKTTIGLAGVDLGWRKAVVDSFCWDSSRLTSASVHTEKWAGFAWCWKDENNFKSWLIYPTRQKYVSRGTLAVTAPWGCSGGQQTISPNVHYERGGNWNPYASD